MQIVDKDGQIEEVEVVLAFEFKDNRKEYVIYTKNETDEAGNITVYISNVDRRSKGLSTLMGVDDELEWERIQEVIRELAKQEGDFAQSLSDEQTNDSIPLSIMQNYGMLTDGSTDRHIIS